MNNYERRSPLRVTSWFREIKGRRKFARLKPVTHVAILFADANHRYLTCHAIAPGTSGDFCQSPWSAWKKCQVCYWPEAFVSKSNDIVNTWARKFFLLWTRKRIKNSYVCFQMVWRESFVNRMSDWPSVKQCSCLNIGHSLLEDHQMHVW